MMKRVFLFLLLILASAFGVAPASAGPFDSWAGLVVAGDSRAHSGAPSEVFDNARQYVAAMDEMAPASPVDVADGALAEEIDKTRLRQRREMRVRQMR